jgi:hypothetical protein
MPSGLQPPDHTPNHVLDHPQQKISNRVERFVWVDEVNGDQGFPSQDQAKKAAKEFYKTSLLALGTRKDYGYNLYKLKREGETLRVRITEVDGVFWCSENPDTRNHALGPINVEEDKIKAHELEHGIDPGLKHALEEFIKDEVKRSGETPTMIQCIRQLGTRHPEYKHSERLQSSGSLDKTKDQFARYLDHRRKKYQTIGPIDTVHALDEMTHDEALQIPENYVPTTNYKNVEELTSALGLPSKDAKRYLPITDDIYEDVKKTDTYRNLSQKDKLTIAQSSVAMCPASIFNLCCFLRYYPAGSRAAYVDGTFNICNDASVLIPFGGMDVRKRGKKKVTSSYRPWLYLTAPGERKVAFVVLLLVAKKYAMLLFGVELVLDYGESDHADAFVRGYMEVFKGIVLLQCNFHVSKGFKEGEPEYRLKFLCKIFKKAAQKMISKLHTAKSLAQFKRCHQLVMDDWTENGECLAVTHWLKVYGREPYMNWFYSIAKHYGIYPTGNPPESYNKELKGDKTQKGLIVMNVDRIQFHSVELQKIMTGLAQTRCGQDIRLPEGITTVELDLVNLMRAGIDCVEDDGDGPGRAWFVNTPRAIGDFITDERLVGYKASLLGDDTPFQAKGKSPWEVASHMINTTNRLCRVQQLSDGSIVGDCIHCTKRLSCSCCAFIKDKLDLLGPLSVSKRVVMLPKPKPGRRKKNDLSGCKPGLLRVEPAGDKTTYYSGKSIEELRKLCELLGLEKDEKDGMVQAIVAKGTERKGETSKLAQVCSSNTTEGSTGEPAHEQW